jgi:hypothetical protein
VFSITIKGIINELVTDVTSPLLQPMDSLQAFQDVLAEAGYSAEQIQVLAGAHYLRLQIPETELFLDIRPDAKGLDLRWEFYLAYPVDVPESRFGQLTHLLSDFNRRLPWGSIGLAEDDTPFFRWSPTTSLSAISAFRLLELVQMVLFLGCQLATQMADMLLRLKPTESPVSPAVG